MLHRVKPFGIILFVFATIGTLILYYLAKPVGFNWSANTLVLISQVLSLVGTVYLALSFLLSSRFPFLEKMIGGLDIIYKAHHMLGALSFIALLHHPLLLAVGKIPNTDLALRYFIPGSNLAYNFGIYALAVMILLLIFTLFVQLPYHIWKNLHSGMGIVLLLGMLHIFFISSDVSRYMPLQVWMFFWMGVGLISFIYKFFFYQKYQDAYSYKINEVNDFGDFVEISLVTNSENKMKYSSGQFIFLSTNNSTVGKESHPFSIASGTDDDHLKLYCKKLGDYTNRLSLLECGEQVTVNGPYGTFFETLPLRENIVGIAGGIGITPFLSLIKSEKEISNKNLTLFHVVKNKSDSFLENASYCNIGDNVKTIVHESNSQGRFSVEAIKNSLDNMKDKTFYLCGPLSMMESLRTQLLSVGVRPSKIIFEDFSFKS